MRDEATGKVKTRAFANRRQDFPRLFEWLDHQAGEPRDRLHILLETTGIYNETLAYWLYAEGRPWGRRYGSCSTSFMASSRPKPNIGHKPSDAGFVTG
ncbi:hypothetical protein QHL1GM_05065 [Halomonas sp. QHL1]|nr:hypothetical protein QHL1GM_05065 [Halomonas sp. QHL1]